MIELDKNLIVEIVDTCREKGDRNFVNWEEAIHRLEIQFQTVKSFDAWRSLYRNAKAKFDDEGKTEYDTEKVSKSPEGEEQVLEIEIGENGVQRSTILVDIVKLRGKSSEDILKLHGYDILQWKLVNHKMKIWNTYSKKDGTTTLFSSSITVKPIQFEVTTPMLQEIFEEVASKYMLWRQAPYYNPPKADEEVYLFEMGIYDVHLGKFAWHEETGNDYDLKIAEATYRMVVEDLLLEARRKNVERILIVFGNDFFHVDNAEETTTAGTKQDTDTRLPKMFRKGCDLVVWTIEEALKVAPVTFLFVPSNHDYTLGFFLSELIYRLYKDVENVELFTKTESRKYYRYGRALLGFTHGDKEGKNLYEIMQVEAKELWAETDIHEWHVGHWHSEGVEERKELTIRKSPSITATDMWHYQKGFIGVRRKAIATFWHKELGDRYKVTSDVKHLIENQEKS